MSARDQEAIRVLREVLADREAMERKLRKLIRDSLIDSDVLAGVLSRLDNLEDDIQTAIDELGA